MWHSKTSIFNRKLRRRYLSIFFSVSPHLCPSLQKEDCSAAFILVVGGDGERRKK